MLFSEKKKTPKNSSECKKRGQSCRAVNGAFSCRRNAAVHSSSQSRYISSPLKLTEQRQSLAVRPAMKRLQCQCPILPGGSPELAWISSPVQIRTAETEESLSEDDGEGDAGEFVLLVHINGHLIVRLEHK